MMLLLPLLLAGCSGPAASTDDQTPTVTPPATTPDVDQLMVALEGMFAVGEGKLSHIEANECCGAASCDQRDPNAAHGVYRLPLSLGESFAGRDMDEERLQVHYRLKPDEAVLFVGKTPSDLSFFSFRTYLHEREIGGYGRPQIDGSLGDSINPFSMGVVGEQTQDALTIVVTASDYGVFEAIRDTAVQAGFPPEAVNFDPLPQDLLQLGLDEDDDTVSMRRYMAGFTNLTSQQNYLSSPDASVFRLTPRLDLEQFQSDPVMGENLTQPGSGTNEDDLQDAVIALGQAIEGAYPDRLAIASPTTIDDVANFDTCSFGCNRDHLGFRSADFTLPIAATDEFLVVYGVNHVATGKSSFQTAMVVGSFNDDAAAVVNSNQFAGSAQAFLPDHPDADKLYAWQFRRDCAGQSFCTEVAVQCPGLTAGELGSIQWRAYIEPATGVRPLADELLPDQAIKFLPIDASSP